MIWLCCVGWMRLWGINKRSRDNVVVIPVLYNESFFEYNIVDK